jgi:hypothetical protein
MGALDAHGATLTLQGDSVKVTAPEPLPDGLMAALRAHKADVVVALRDQTCEPPRRLPPVHNADDPHNTPATPCAACGSVAWRAESRDWRWQWVCGQCRPEMSDEAADSLPPVHDAHDPWAKPSARCAACGAVHWRVWCHDERKVWQWICNRCWPLVVVHKDGRRWRA